MDIFNNVAATKLGLFQEPIDFISDTIDHKTDILTKVPIIGNVPIPKMRNVAMMMKPNGRVQDSVKDALGLNGIKEAFALGEEDAMELISSVLPLFGILEEKMNLPAVKLQALTESRLINTLLSLPDDVLSRVLIIAQKLTETTNGIKVGFASLAHEKASNIVEILSTLKNTLKETVTDVTGITAGIVPDVVFESIFELIILAENIVSIKSVQDMLKLPNEFNLSDRQLLKLLAVGERFPDVEDTVMDMAKQGGFLSKAVDEQKATMGGTALVANTSGVISKWVEVLGQAVHTLIDTKAELLFTSEEMTFELARFILNDLVLNGTMDVKEAAIRMIGAFGLDAVDLINNGLIPLVPYMSENKIWKGIDEEIRSTMNQMIELYAEYSSIVGVTTISIEEFITGKRSMLQDVFLDLDRIQMRDAFRMKKGIFGMLSSQDELDMDM